MIELTGAEIAVAEEKRHALVSRLRELAPVVVALSGGTDSCFLLAMAIDSLDDRASAAIGVSPSLASADLEEARRFARSLNASLLEVTTAELDDPGYVRNAGDRCFHCKQELYRRMLASTEHIRGRTIVDGTNASDLTDDRPGMRAARELGVRSPLLEVGLGKREIRHLSRVRGLPTWDRPEAACLASRVPVGTPVTAGSLGRIEAAERVLRRHGIRQVRVRHHGTIARIETDASGLARVVEHRERIVAELRTVGYAYVTLDLAGYQRGGRAETDGQINREDH